MRDTLKAYGMRSSMSRRGDCWDTQSTRRPKGGNIVNVAINSAFRAAAEDVPVSMRHVVQSIEREYMKLGKVFVRSDFERS